MMFKGDGYNLSWREERDLEREGVVRRAAVSCMAGRAQGPFAHDSHPATQPRRVRSLSVPNISIAGIGRQS